MVVERSERRCLLCGAPFEGRTFLCRSCSERYRAAPVPLDVRRRFYAELDRAYPQRSNTYGAYNEPVALMRVFERLPRWVRILELGAGGGFLALKLCELGFTKLTLTDFTETTLTELRARVPHAAILEADASALPFPAGAFEVVVSSDVIEHLESVDAHLAEVARVLTPGGLYLVKTPNRRLAEEFYRLRGLHDSYFWHPSMLAPGELREVFSRHGFAVRFLRAPNLTNAQLAKLPGPRALRGAASRLPLGWLPSALQPHLEVVARLSDRSVEHVTPS